MKEYRADLHIHTVLSPCGDLRMSPVNIISEAERKGLSIIGITDHNSTRHCRLIKKMAAEKGIFVMMGAEVTTKEEVHCLAFFEHTDTLDEFQEFLDVSLPDFRNIPDIFGDQVIVDENEHIIGTEEKLLTNALTASIDEIGQKVRSLSGIFIPAHIDRLKNGLYGQLGFLPDNLRADALEVSWMTGRKDFAAKHPEIEKFSLITSSDAHRPEQVGLAPVLLQICTPGFPEVKMALQGLNGRRIAG